MAAVYGTAPPRDTMYAHSDVHLLKPRNGAMAMLSEADNGQWVSIGAAPTVGVQSSYQPEARPPTRLEVRMNVDPRLASESSAARLTEALLPLGSRMRMKHRPWSNPLCALALAAGTALYVGLGLLLIVQSNVSIEVCHVHVDTNSSAIGNQVLDSYRDTFLGGSATTVWIAIIAAMTIGALWLLSLTFCAKAGLYGTLAVSFTLQLALCIVYFEFVQPYDAIPPVFVAVVILVVACVLQQKIHIVAKTANEAAVLLKRHWHMVGVAALFLIFNITLLLFTLYAIVVSFDVRTKGCHHPGLWLWVVRVYLFGFAVWLHAAVGWIRGLFVAGTVAIAYFREDGARGWPTPVWTPLKWSLTKSLGVASLGSAVSLRPVVCCTCCYGCWWCCGLCAPQQGTYELDGLTLRWDRTKGALKPCVKYMQDHDCLRTLKIMPAMVQSYAAITGHDLWTSTQHVHSMLMCHDMWTWAMQIYSLCESLTTMLVVVVMLFAGSFGFFYGYFHSSESDLFPRLMDGIALTTVTGTVTTVISLFYTRILVMAVGSVLMCFTLDKVHEVATTAARAHAREEYLSKEASHKHRAKQKSVASFASFGLGGGVPSASSFVAPRWTWATVPLLQHLAAEVEAGGDVSGAQAAPLHRLAPAAASGMPQRDRVEVGTVVVKQKHHHQQQSPRSLELSDCSHDRG